MASNHSIELTPEAITSIFNGIPEYRNGHVKIVNIDILIRGMMAIMNQPIGGGNDTPLGVFLENMVKAAVEMKSRGVEVQGAELASADPSRIILLGG